MSGQRLTEQLQLVFTTAEEESSSTVGREDAEPVVAKCEPERPAVTNSLMEAVCERENLKKALRRVKANKGSPGVDGMTVEQFPDYLRMHWRCEPSPDGARARRVLARMAGVFRLLRNAYDSPTS